VSLLYFCIVRLLHLFNRVDNTSYHLSFINIHILRHQLFDGKERMKIQPSFILAGLAMALLLKSSEADSYSAASRNRALQLRERAQSALSLSWNRRWIDSSLAEAALVSLQMRLLSSF